MSGHRGRRKEVKVSPTPKLLAQQARNETIKGQQFNKSTGLLTALLERIGFGPSK